MTSTSDATRPSDSTSALVEREIAVEQQHVDRVYTEIAKASGRARRVAADGLARGRTERTGQAREEELTGLFERDALVFHAARRQMALDSQYEGLVFGRLDLTANGSADGDRETRYVGRLGVRDDDYEPLVIDWRAPAASPFYRATPADPHGVIRRRVLRCRGDQVVGVEDDLMVPDPPDDLPVVGDGALLAALSRSRGARMRDIVATIQSHQDEAIRAPERGVTEITGGPGTGKTVVALHRAAYLLYSNRRRFEGGGILVVGPSTAYTAYIERVLPSLGEESVVLRSLGDVVDAVSTDRLDEPGAAGLKGSLRIRQVLARAARDRVPQAPQVLRLFVAGIAVRLDRDALDRVAASVLRHHPRNLGRDAVRLALVESLLREATPPDREEFVEALEDHPDLDDFVARWWPQVDPREVLLWLADRERLERYALDVLDPLEVDQLHDSMLVALRSGTWSVADAALIDDVAARIGPVQPAPKEESGFYGIELLEELEAQAPAPPPRLAGGVTTAGQGGGAGWTPRTSRGSDPVEVLLRGQIDPPQEYLHLLVDEAQDLSPMQWRMLGRRSRRASWTVVGDAAQSSWPDPVEAAVARDEAWTGLPRRGFHMTTNYRNAREIFDMAAEMIRLHVPDADIPAAVRVTGIEPETHRLTPEPATAVGAALERLLGEVDGSIAVVAPARYAESLAAFEESQDVTGRLRVLDPMAVKGLEFDATVIVDPDEIVRDSPGGVRALYVALTRAAHRMTVLRPQ